MPVRAKFQVTSITKHAWGGVTIKLTPQYDNTIEEDRRFAKATPTGEISLQVDNPVASDQLTLGTYFYVDFVEVPKPQTATA
jgi:hypothetical protein